MDKEIVIDGFKYHRLENNLYENVDGNALYKDASSWACADEHVGMDAIGYTTENGFYAKYVALPGKDIREFLRVMDDMMSKDKNLESIKAFKYPSDYIGGLA